MGTNYYIRSAAQHHKIAIRGRKAGILCKGTHYSPRVGPLYGSRAVARKVRPLTSRISSRRHWHQAFIKNVTSH